MDRLHFEVFIVFFLCAFIESATGRYAPIQSPALFSPLANGDSLSSLIPAAKGSHLAGNFNIQGRAATRTRKIAAVTPKPAAQTLKPVAAPPTLKPESPTTHSPINTAPAGSESQSAAAKGVDGPTSTATNGSPVPIVPVQENTDSESDGESTSRTVRIIMGLVVLNLAIGMILCGIGVYVCVKRRKDGQQEVEGATYAQVGNTEGGRNGV